MLLLPRPPAPEPPAVTVYPYPAMADALTVVLRGAPGVLGVGELHQTVDTAAIPSSLARFTREILPMIAPRASDLIVETWVTDGSCGRAETATVAGVEKTTERPAATESEIVTLLRRAKESGVQPHVLRVDCADYRLLSPSGKSSKGSAGASVDFQRMLALIERKLEAKVTEVLAARAAAARGDVAHEPQAAKMVVVYGGALHNDLHPDPALAAFSYGVPIFHATGGRYRELDLYVPEYLERNPAMRSEDWFPLWQRTARPGQLVLIRRSAESFVLVFPASLPQR